MIYNKFLEYLILPIGDLINNSTVIKELRKWRELSMLPEEKIKDIEKNNLIKLLNFASSEVPYYKKYSVSKNENPFNWIKQFPILTKTDINSNLNQLVTRPIEKLIEKKSSGSSGIQGTIYMNNKEQSLNRAIQILWWEWAGWQIGKPILQTGMTVKRGVLKSLKDIIFRTKYYIAFGLSNSEIHEILKLQKGKYNFFMGGYASSLYLMAKLAIKYNLNNIKFKGAISWGDKMFPHFRTTIKEAFHCNVFDTYGCSEGLMIAAQKDLDYYYIMSPHVYLEIVDKDGNDVPDGDLGYVVATRLDSRSMPLIRYYTGDLAVKLPRDKYPENRKLKFPLLEKIVGRDTDIVFTRSGKYMIVHFFTGIFEYFPEIKQFRVIQHDLDSIDIEYIKSLKFEFEILLKIENKINNYLKESFTVNWVEVSEIPSTLSGKPQIIKSFMGNKL